MNKSSIYIGLGGTGLKAIAHTKKMFEDQYGVGNIPPEIAFLAVDFDKSEPSKPGIASDISTDFLQLQGATNPRKFYDTNKDQLQWMFNGNVRYLAERISDGAGQVRTTGRLYTEIVIRQFRNSLDAAITNVTNIANQAAATHIDIYLVFSMAGGTGAGSFMTLAQDIYVRYRDQVKIYAYGVLHGIFESIDVSGNLTPRVFSNAYTSLLDVDYLMHASDENPVPFVMDQRTHNITAPIFEEFYLINNETAGGERVKTIDDLCKVVGTTLFVSSGDVGAANVAAGNNITWKNGSYNVHNKQGWVYGLGACSVVYRGELLAEIYGAKAAIELIRNMIQEGSDIHGKALEWTEIVGIREDNQNEDNTPHDMLIEAIYSKADITRLPECSVNYRDSDANIKTELNKYLNRLINFPTKTDLDNRSSNYITNLNDKVRSMLLTNNGIGNALAFVLELKNLCEKFRDEMSDEQEKIDLDINGKLENLFGKNLKEYEAECNRFMYKFKSGTEKQEIIEDYLCDPATEILQLKHESKRREAAYAIFVTLLAEIDLNYNKLSNLKRDLKNIKEDYKSELINKQTNVPSSLIFEYDLSVSDRRNIQIDSSHINVDVFMNNLPTFILQIANQEVLKNAIDRYVSNLPISQEYKQRRIVDVINNLSEENYADLKRRVEILSGTLLRYDDPGLRTIDGDFVCDAIARSYRVVLNAEGTDSIRMKNDPEFLKYKGFEPEWLCSQSMNHQKMIFCRTEGAIIPYCLAAFPSHRIETKYTSLIKQWAAGAETFMPHYDKNLFDQMRANDFSLKPEMKNEAMFYWISGHFFGWEKVKEEEREMKRDEKTGDILGEGSSEYQEHLKFIRFKKKKYEYCSIDGENVEWESLDNTSLRDKAFNYFKTVILPEYKEQYLGLIKKLYRGKVEYWQGEINRIKASGLDEYINKLVCNDKNSMTYKGKKEYDLVKSEFKYICNDLISALENLK